MKVVILANIDGGLYKFRSEVIRKLREKHEVIICVPEGRFTQVFKDMGCRFVDCSLLERRGTSIVADLKLFQFYYRFLKEEMPDMVFTYTIKPNVYGGMACSLLGIPYVVNITGLGSAVENGGLMQKLTLFLYKLGLKKAQKVFFQNTANRDFMLQQGVIKGEYDLLPGSGVNLEHYYLMDYPQGDTIDFLFIARVMKQKGIDQYLDCAKYIREKYPQTRFHICGFCEEAYQEVLKDLNDKGIIIYHGLVDNMVEMQAMSSCTLHPTFYPEGLSNVLLESCASGRPIITTDRPGCREVVDNGVNGYVVKERDSQDLIEKVEKFLSLSYEERREMGLAGRRKVEKEFDRKIVIDKYLKELE